MLTGLRGSIKIAKLESQTEKEYLWARDNSVASFGKIIKY